MTGIKFDGDKEAIQLAIDCLDEIRREEFVNAVIVMDLMEQEMYFVLHEDQKSAINYCEQRNQEPYTHAKFVFAQTEEVHVVSWVKVGYNITYGF